MPTSLIATLINAEGKRCMTNKDKAHTLFNATCVATAECNLTDITHNDFLRIPDPNAKYFKTPDSYFTPSSTREAINDIHPMEAPGPDCIQNCVCALAWDVIKEHVSHLFSAVTSMGFMPER